jgi:DnaK suppressor protein
MNKPNLRRYQRLLLEKRHELSLARGLVPAAGGWAGDLMDQARLEDGTYGICAHCSRFIPRARLEAVPWTRLCRVCMEAQDS